MKHDPATFFCTAGLHFSAFHIHITCNIFLLFLADAFVRSVCSKRTGSFHEVSSIFRSSATSGEGYQ